MTNTMENTFNHKILKGNFGEELYVKDLKIGGYTGFFKDFPNIVTQGETVEEAQKNLWNTAYDILKYFTENKKNIG